MAKGSGGAGRGTGRNSGGTADGGPRGNIREVNVGFAPGEDISQWAVPASARAYRSPAPTPTKPKQDKYAAIQKERAKKQGTAYNMAQKYTLNQLLSMRASATTPSRVATIDRAISMRADSMRKR